MLQHKQEVTKVISLVNMAEILPYMFSIVSAWPITLVEINHEIIFMVICLLSLIQEGHCHLLAKVCALINHLENE